MTKNELGSSSPELWSLETGGAKIQGHPGLHSQFEASQGFYETLFKTKLQQKRNNCMAYVNTIHLFKLNT